MLTLVEKALRRDFAEQTKAEVINAIKTKSVTKYGAVNSSGRLANSVEIKYTDNGFQIWANGYITDRKSVV